MKRTLSLFVAFIMLFNLTSQIFAETIVSEKYFNQNKKYKTLGEEFTQVLNQEKQKEVQNATGLTFEEYKKFLQDYAKKNKIDFNTIDLQATWEGYLQDLKRYEDEYRKAAKLFASKTSGEVISSANAFLSSKEDERKSYLDGNTYLKISYLHAAVHNFVTRTTTGYTTKGPFLWSQEEKEKYTVEDKIKAVSLIYDILVTENINPVDRNALWDFAYDIVLNGKKYFDNDFSKTSIGLGSVSDKINAINKNQERQNQALGVTYAIALLPALSTTTTQKAQSAQAIYDLCYKIMRDDYAVIGLSSGAQALIDIGTDDSLNKLYTLVADDLYRSWGTDVILSALETLSITEGAERFTAIKNRIKSGLGRYHDKIAKRYMYVDPNKNKYGWQYYSSKNIMTDDYYDVIYTDGLEDIGKLIGTYSNNAKIANIANKIVNRYLEDNDWTIRNSEKKIHTSLVVGILATTKQKNDNLTKAAKIIYQGSWWDLNEPTQRDKNNIAANYLYGNNPVFKIGYNKTKAYDYAALERSKVFGSIVDSLLMATFLGTFILSVPSIIKKISNFSLAAARAQARIVLKNIATRNLKIKQGEVVKPTEVKTGGTKPSEVKPTEVKAGETKPSETKPVETKSQQAKPTEVKPTETKPSTEKAEVKTQENPVNQQQYTATVGEGGGAAVDAELSAEELARATRKQWLDEMAAKVRHAREAEEMESATAANQGKVSPYRRNWLMNKPWAELEPWRQKLITWIINLKINMEILFSSLRIFKPKYAPFSASLPVTTTAEAFLKPLAAVESAKTAEGTLGVVEGVKASEAASEASNTARAAKSVPNMQAPQNAPVGATSSLPDWLNTYWQFSAGRGLLSGGVGINLIYRDIGENSGTPFKYYYKGYKPTPASSLNEQKADILPNEQTNKKGDGVLKDSDKPVEDYKEENISQNKDKISEDQNQVQQTNNTQQVMEGLKKEIFGTSRVYNGKLYMAIFPIIPDIIIQLLNGDITFQQLNNRTQAIETAFANAQEKTIANLSSIDSAVAVEFFLSVLRAELKALGVDEKKINQILEISQQYLIDQIPEDVRKAESERAFQKAFALEQNGGDDQKVLEAYDYAIAWDNTNAKAYYRRTRPKLYLHDKTIKDDYEKAIALDPENEDYKDDYKHYLENYKDQLALKGSISGIFRDLNKRIPEILAGIKGQKITLTEDEKQAKAKDLAQKAFQKRIDGYIRTALAYYDEAISLDPNKAEYYYERALIKDQDFGNYEEAVDDYEKAINLDPENAEYYSEKASKAISIKMFRKEEAKKHKENFDSYFNTGDMEKATESINKAIELDPYNAEYYYLRGTMQLDNLEDCIADIEKAINLDPNVAKYHVAYGSYNLLQGNILIAFSAINTAIDLDPYNGENYALRAKIRSQLKDDKGTLQDHNMAVKLAPKNATLYISRANFRLFAGDVKGALEDYISAIKLDPENETNYIWCALIRIKLGDIKGAVADYNKAIKLDPEEETYYILRGNAKIKNGDYISAIEDFTAAIELDFENAEAYYGRATAKHSLQGAEVSLDDYNTAIELNSINAEFYYGRGLVLKEQENYADALEDFDNAIALDGNKAQYYYERYTVRKIFDDMKGALEDLDNAIKNDNTVAKYYYERGLIKESRSDFKGAAKDFESALKLDQLNKEYFKKYRKYLR